MAVEAGRGFDRTELLLWLGVVTGVALTLLGVLAPPEGTRGEAMLEAAVVDGVAIPKERFDANIAALAKEERAPRLDREQRERILNELIAEELLLAHALRMDMARANPLARKLMVESMVDLAGTLGGEERPTEELLRREYEASRQSIAAPKRYRVDTLFFRNAKLQARERAETAARKLSEGGTWSDLASLADAPTTPLPPGALEVTELRTYIGPTAAAAVARMKRGESAGPLRIAGGHLLVRLVETRTPAPPPFEQIRDALEDRWRRKRKDERVRAYVQTLRGRAEIRVNSSMLAAPPGARETP